MILKFLIFCKSFWKQSSVSFSTIARSLEPPSLLVLYATWQFSMWKHARYRMKCLMIDYLVSPMTQVLSHLGLVWRVAKFPPMFKRWKRRFFYFSLVYAWWFFHLKFLTFLLALAWTCVWNFSMSSFRERLNLFNF